MEYYTDEEDVCCEKCGEHPFNIAWDYSYDYDGNDNVHTYGKYYCECGHSAVFTTNDPYENDEE